MRIDYLQKGKNSRSRYILILTRTWKKRIIIELNILHVFSSLRKLFINVQRILLNDSNVQSQIHAHYKQLITSLHLTVVTSRRLLR